MPLSAPPALYDIPEALDEPLERRRSSEGSDNDPVLTVVARSPLVTVLGVPEWAATSLSDNAPEAMCRLDGVDKIDSELITTLWRILLRGFGQVSPAFRGDVVDFVVWKRPSEGSFTISMWEYRGGVVLSAGSDDYCDEG